MSKIIDKEGNQGLVEKLQELGLSDKEAAVYLALLPRQDIGSSKLIQTTGLHGQFVYDALAKLESLGLARHVIQRGRKKFSANTPNRLLSLVEEKRLAAQSVAKELQNRFAGSHEQDFEVYQGESAFIAHQLDQLRKLPEGTTVDVFASHTERYMATFELYGMAEEYERIRVEREIHTRYIGAEAQRERLQKMSATRELWEYKIFPGLGVGQMSIEIHPESVNFVVYGNEILDFALLSKDAAAGYREFFNALWAMAKK